MFIYYDIYASLLNKSYNLIIIKKVIIKQCNQCTCVRVSTLFSFNNTKYHQKNAAIKKEKKNIDWFSNNQHESITSLLQQYGFSQKCAKHLQVCQLEGRRAATSSPSG